MRDTLLTSAFLQLASELAVLQQLHHESLISYLFTVDEGARFSVVMDWAGKGLTDLVELQQPLGEDVARYIAFQLTDSLVYLHSKVSCSMSMRALCAQ
jgi:serine/threonine protein kinase